MRSSVDFWYLLISRRATVPGLHLCFLFTPATSSPPRDLRVFVGVFLAGAGESVRTDQTISTCSVESGRREIQYLILSRILFLVRKSSRSDTIRLQTSLRLKDFGAFQFSTCRLSCGLLSTCHNLQG